MEPRVCPMRQDVFLTDSNYNYDDVSLGVLNYLYDEQVVSEMREIVSKDNQNLTSNSFLLDDDLRYTYFSHPCTSNLLAVLTLVSWMNQYE